MDSEQRQARRKVLKVKAQLAVDGLPAIEARTADVGAEGCSLIVPTIVRAGTHCMVHFELFHDGKAVAVKARARVQYCILSNGEFKAGFRFVTLDMAALSALSKFLN